MQNDELSIHKKATRREVKSYLTAIFTGWGIPGGIARIISGAVLGALSAFWALSQTGCTVEWTLSPDGASTWHGSVMPNPPGEVLHTK